MVPVNGSLRISADSLNVSTTDFSGGKLTGASPFYILDGQQRITSIARVFCNLDQDIQYFFDCLAILIDRFPENGLEKLSICKNSQKQYSRMEYLCIGIKIGKNKTFVEQKENYRFIGANNVIEGEYATLINMFIREIEEEITNEDIKKYTNFLASTLGKVSQYSISQTVIEGSSDLGVVCRIFEKINASGKKLTIFDLINAKSFDYKEYAEGVAEYLRKDLKSANKTLMPSLKFYFEYKDDFENLARIIRILFLIEQLDEGKAPHIINSVMLKKKSNYWFDMWDKYKSTIIDVVDYFYNDGILRIAPLSYFEYMIAVMCANPSTINNQYFKEIIKKYALGLSINGRSFSKSDLDIVSGFNSFAKDLANAHQQDAFSLDSCPDTKVALDKGQLKISSPSNNRFKAAYYIMVKEKFEGKFINDITNLPINYLNDNTQQHHLIPRASTKGDNNALYQSIANIIPLNKDSNQSRIKDKKPDIYLPELKKIFQLKFDNLLEQNLIFESNEYKVEFLEKRFLMIASYIERYFND